MIRIARGRAEELGQRPAPGRRHRADPRDQRRLRTQLAGPADPDPQRDRRRAPGRAGEDRAADAGAVEHPGHRGAADHARRRGPAAAGHQGRLQPDGSAPRGLDPLAVLRVPADDRRRMQDTGEVTDPRRRSTCPRPTTGWRRFVLPLRLAASPVGRAVLSARIDLDRLRDADPRQPVRQDRRAHRRRRDRRGRCSTRTGADLADYAIVTEALGLLCLDLAPVARVEPYTRPDGELMLGAYAFPRRFRLGDPGRAAASATPISPSSKMTRSLAVVGRRRAGGGGARRRGAGLPPSAGRSWRSTASASEVGKGNFAVAGRPRRALSTTRSATWPGA